MNEQTAVKPYAVPVSSALKIKSSDGRTLPAMLIAANEKELMLRFDSDDDAYGGKLFGGLTWRFSVGRSRSCVQKLSRAARTVIPYPLIWQHPSRVFEICAAAWFRHRPPYPCGSPGAAVPLRRSLNAG